MVRFIDRFIAAMRREGADELVFATAEPVRLMHGSQVRVLLAQPVQSDQIHTIVAEFAPPELTVGLTVDGEARVVFDALGGPIAARIRRANGQFEVVLRPHRTGATLPPEAPSVAPPVAPIARPARERSISTVAPGPRRIDGMLRALVELRASDLHLTAEMQPRMRRDGDMQLLTGFEGQSLSGATIRALLIETAPASARERFERTRDADFAYEIPGLARFRVNLFRDRRGVSGVLRVIPSKILSADALGLPPAVREFCGLAKGLVLVTGPTGSGKSTTLAAMIDLINRTRHDHIITIEDPVEFVHESASCLVNQREVHADTDSFASALRAALREDPDIVLVGELRDLETVSIAIETAETGHLVFGTLHTNTAVSTVDRMVDQFPADRQSQIRTMLSASLRGVVAQTLCKRVGGGRVAALEVLVSSAAVANLIREGKTYQLQSVMQTQRAQGQQTMNDALLRLVQSGLVAPEEALLRAVDRQALRGMIDAAPTPPR